MIKKNLSRGLKLACALGITAAAVATTFTTTNVVASASAPTGTCALVASKSSLGQGGVVNGATASMIGTVTFDGNYAIDLQNVSTNGGDSASTELSTASGTTRVGSVRASGTYPVAIVGIETDSHGNQTNMNASFLFLPTNNNLTYLVSSNNNGSGGSFTGVCQVQ